MRVPSVLIVDDGELDSVQALLERADADWVRCLEPSTGTQLQRPRDLLITSGPRAMRMPPAEGDTQPLWVCVYDRDFLPLRERLRDLGVHFLVSSELAPRTFELFMRQLLHGSEERRGVRRIPLYSEVELEVGFERRKAVLHELSRESCVFQTAREIPEQRRVIVRLPPELTGDHELELPGRVLSSVQNPCAPERGFSNVLCFVGLEGDAMARIHYLLSGHALGTQVTPLHAEPERRPEESVQERWISPRDVRPGGRTTESGDRRAAARHEYTRDVAAVDWAGEPEPPIALARDLSLTGLRVSASPAPEPGSAVSLALYGGARQEPMLIDARVVRVDGTDVGLRFGDLDIAQRQFVERLIASAPGLESLEAGGRTLHVAELVVV